MGFSYIYSNCGYCPIPVKEEEKDNTTFTSQYLTYRFNLMPFWWTNAPSTLQRTFDVLLNRYDWNYCLVNLYEILIFSKDRATHLLEMEKVLAILRRSGPIAENCELFTTSIMYLCHIFNPWKPCINDAHMRSLVQSSHPRTITELRSFLAVCNVYRRFALEF